MIDNIQFVKELLEVRLDNLDEKIDVNNKNINEKIDSNNNHIMELLHYIREQTTRTNGRLLKAEDAIKTLSDNYPGKQEICKINQRLEALDEQNLIIKVWNRYPKALFMGIVVAVLITMGTLGYTLISVHDMIQKVKYEEAQQLNKQSMNNENVNYKIMELFKASNN